MNSDANTNRVQDVERFRQLWRDCLLESASDESAVIHRDLLDAYSEPQRQYHTLTHIEHCLSLFDQIKNLIQNPAALELAIWFHDVIYVLGASDNEQRSADLFMAKSEGKFDDHLRDTVYRHIMATLHDGSSIDHIDTQYMLDIDLSSFGRPWPEFFQDSENLRLEMKDLPDDDYYRKQEVFQAKIFGGKKFFKSDYFRDHYESQAQQNHRDYAEVIKQKLATTK